MYSRCSLARPLASSSNRTLSGCTPASARASLQRGTASGDAGTEMPRGAPISQTCCRQAGLTAGQTEGVAGLGRPGGRPGSRAGT